MREAHRKRVWERHQQRERERERERGNETSQSQPVKQKKGDKKCIRLTLIEWQCQWS